ncbi:MAG TPA: hypothetical protein PKC30_10875 [Saprospiraceae bacterium]|nr:hypothetical protein [Saprospiraceae bacterium]
MKPIWIIMLLAIISLFILWLIPGENINSISHSTKSHFEVDSTFAAPVKKGLLENEKITEASGLVASRTHSNLLYTHNDSGGKPYIYKLDKSGKHKGKITITNVKNRDWEDIAMGQDPESGKWYIYVGEIGDNEAKYPSIFIYRFEEPADLSKNVEVEAEIFELQYPTGPRDAETLMFDPHSQGLYIVTKREKYNIIFKTQIDQLHPKSVTLLDSVGTLPFTSATAGDISPDGLEILVKNYKKVFYWTRQPGESIGTAMARKPRLLNYIPEPQGEAISFNALGSGYYTVSEVKKNIRPMLYFYERVIDIASEP